MLSTYKSFPCFAAATAALTAPTSPVRVTKPFPPMA
ncbi:secreted protein [gut metagenome]|uniref:Secreted protein n=1 Tax=gut metagenome TaxID=749906 RepID=J9G6W8_9ZZZZ